MTGLILVVSLLGYYVEPPEPTTLVFPPFGHCMGIYRAGTEELAVLLGGLVRFDDPQGLCCVKLEEWDDPSSPSDDDELAVYGVNSGTSQIIYNSTMYTLGLYGEEGSGLYELLHPHGLAAQTDGDLFVADTGNGRVMRLHRSGRRIEPEGVLLEGLVEPWDVAVNGRGEIFVTDRAGCALYFLESPDDAVPDTLVLDSPRGVAATGGERWSHHGGDFQVVITGDGTSICRIEDMRVTATADLADLSRGSMMNYPAIDYFGNVWVTDSIECALHKFDEDLSYLISFGSCGTGDREFEEPTGLAIWERFGQVFIAESEGARYFCIGTDVFDWDFRETDRGFELSFGLAETSTVLAEVTDAHGEMIIWPFNGRPSGTHVSFGWDGHDAGGRPVPEGTYYLTLTIRPTYSSRNYFEKTIEEEMTLEPPSTYSEGPVRGGGRF